jgi:hypothetical protein
LDDLFEVIFMALSAVILTPENWICKIDADLKGLLEGGGGV